MKSKAKRALFLLSLMVFSTIYQSMPAVVYAVDDKCDIHWTYSIVENTVPAEMRNRDARGKSFVVKIRKSGENFDNDFRLVTLDTFKIGDSSDPLGGSFILDKVEPEPISNSDEITFIIPGDLWFPTEIDGRTVDESVALVVELWKSAGGSAGKCELMRYHVKPDTDLNCWFEAQPNPNDPSINVPAFCYEGLPTEKTVRDAKAEYTWIGFTAIADHLSDLFNGGGTEKINISTVTCAGNNCKTCSSESWQEQERFLRDTFTACLWTKRLTVGGIAGVGIASVVVTGGVSAIALAGVAGGAATRASIMDAAGDCAPFIRAKVVTEDGDECTSELRFTPTADGGSEIDIGNDRSDDLVVQGKFAIQQYELCEQVPGSSGNNTTPRGKCFECLESEGIWTAVGCVPSDLTGLVGAVVAIGLSIGGGVALLMIIVAAYMFSISQGDPKKTNMGKEILTAAVVGLLFVIFSITMLRIIAVDIIQLPGFGT